MPRIYAFIDSPNLDLGVKYQGWKLDYSRFRVYLLEKYGVEKAFMFIRYMDTYKKLYDALSDYGYELIYKPKQQWTQARGGGNVNNELILQAVAEAPFYEKALIVSGDGNLYCLIDYLKKRNKFLRLLVPNASKYSNLLKFHASNQIDFVNQLQGKLEYVEDTRRS